MIPDIFRHRTLPCSIVIEGRSTHGQQLTDLQNRVACIFDALRETPPGVNDEIQLTDAMKLLMEKRAMYGRLFDGVRHDVGNKLDFIKTNIVLGLQREDIGAELREWLKGLG